MYRVAPRTKKKNLVFFLKKTGSLGPKMGRLGGRGWAAAAAAGGRTRACVRRPDPWCRAWRSAACAFGGAAGLRRHLVCAHRGCWGGAVRQTGAGAVGGGGACAAIASRGRRRRDGWSRPFPCAPSRRTGGRRHCRGPKFVVDRCVLEPMPAARAHAVCARAVHPRAGRVVHLCSVRSDRATSARHHRRHRGGAPARALCWRCACLRCRACVPHARVACTCCACACCACLRYARLRFPCSRCVHLLCLPLLCVPVLCAFVRCVVCLCSAHLHRVELAEPASPSTLATCHDLYPFPILSHICLLLSCIVPPSLPHFLLVLFLLFIPYFTAYLVLFLPAAVPPKGGTGLVVRS